MQLHDRTSLHDVRRSRQCWQQKQLEPSFGSCLGARCPARAAPLCRYPRVDVFELLLQNIEAGSCWL